jgi:hypothetical protein
MSLKVATPKKPSILRRGADCFLSVIVWCASKLASLTFLLLVSGFLLSIGVFLVGSLLVEGIGSFFYNRVWPTRTSSRLFAWNFASLILLGVAISAWLYFRTDYFELFASIIGFGSILSWLAFVTKVIPETEGKEIQKTIFGFFLGSRFAWAVYLLLLAAAVMVSGTVGTIELESAQTGADYQVTIYPVGTPRPKEPEERLPAANRLRHLCYLPSWEHRKFKVAVTGLPEQEVDVEPWWHRPWWHRTPPLRVPYSYLRPVVLIGATDNLIAQALADREHYTYRMEIRVDAAQFHLNGAYLGKSVYLGCTREDAIEVPKYVQDGWAKVLTSHPELAADLLAPVPLADAIVDKEKQDLADLPPDLTGKRIQVRVYREKSSRELYAQTPVMTVRSVQSLDTLVQPFQAKPNENPP